MIGSNSIWETSSSSGTATGRELKRWTFPEALFDSSAFLSSGCVLSVRLETRTGQGEPFNNRDPANPNVWRIRELWETGEPRLLGEISGDEGRVGSPFLKPEGDLFLVLAERMDLYDGKRLVVTAYELPSRRRLWTIGKKDSDVSVFAIDPTWTMAALQYEGMAETQVVDLATGRPPERWHEFQPRRRGGNGDRPREQALFNPGSATRRSLRNGRIGGFPR